MRKFGFLLVGLLLLAGQVNAIPDNFDIYGVDTKTKQKIYDACSDLMSEHLAFTTKLYTSGNPPSTKDLLYKERLEQRIIQKARHYGRFLHAKVSSVYYPTDKITYATLDLVKSTDIDRIPRQATASLTKHEIKVSNDLNNLFILWKSYVDRKLDLMRKNQVDMVNSTCPVLHCTWGFDKYDQQTTLPKLIKGVAKYKSELFKIINNSLDDERREDAVFILAHSNDYNEIANYLINFTDDSSDGVRNNVMRVLGAIAAKYDMTDLDINRILRAINFPYVTDRNKAAYVLLGLIKRNPSYHRQVIQQAGFTLIELLKLKQPNNHDFAYQILKEISHQSYGDQDYDKWEKWIISQQQAT